MVINPSDIQDFFPPDTVEELSLGYSTPGEEDLIPEVLEPQADMPGLDFRQTCVVDPHAFLEAKEQAGARGHDENGRAVALAFEEYGALADLKGFAQAPDNIPALFLQLRQRFPNFQSFITEMEGLCSRAALRPMRDIPPTNILLVGPPGLGKTTVTQAIANAIGTSCHQISMNGAGAAFELRGLARFYRGTSPGRIAKCFKESAHANPMILLDEIDKHARDVGHARAVDTLLELTEDVTAKSFRDDCLQLEIDASHALFIATANDINALPDALLSRFVVIEVTPPSREQMIQIVRAMHRDLVAAEHGVFSTELPEEVAAHLAECTPREARRRLNGGINAAAIRALKTTDGPLKGIKLELSDLAGAGTRTKRIFGFAPTND